MIITMVEDYGYTGNASDWQTKWSLSNSVLLTLTTLTTIGYGHISPSTQKGKIAMIIYTILGLPLMMLFLANIGNGMANCVKYSYSRLACRMCRVRRRQTELGQEVTKTNRVSKDLVGKEDYMPTDDIQVPIMVTLVIMGLYVFGGAAVYSRWEDWDIISSCYFTFITLTTIGFGDFVPGKNFRGDMTTGQVMKMTFTTFYCLLGLAIISMGINLASEQVKNKCVWLALKVGITETEEEKRKRMIKKSIYAKQTPANKTGRRNPMQKILKKLRLQDV